MIKKLICANCIRPHVVLELIITLFSEERKVIIADVRWQRMQDLISGMGGKVWSCDINQ
jgi:hypothetical protein